MPSQEKFAVWCLLMWHAKAKLTHIIKARYSQVCVLPSAGVRFHRRGHKSPWRISIMYVTLSQSLSQIWSRSSTQYESICWGRANVSELNVSEVSFREKWAWFSCGSIYTDLQANNTTSILLLIYIKQSAKMQVSYHYFMLYTEYNIIIFIYLLLFRRV